VTNIHDLSSFIIRLKCFCEENGFELKSDKDGVCLWPTYDKYTGGIGQWFSLFIKARTQEKTQCQE
jgi:hypothetical protein